MKKLLIIFFFLSFAYISIAQVGIGTNSPNGSSMLEINATNKGVLIPRVTLTGSTDATTIATPATSLLIYNTATTSDVVPGYYYNSGTSGSPVWIRLNTSSLVTGANSGETIRWNSSTSKWQITGTSALALGNQAGLTSQGSQAVALGNRAGYNTQGSGAVALGNQAGYNTQGLNAVALGNVAGQTLQGANAIALGNQAGYNTQGTQAVALGHMAGITLQGSQAIALGTYAGYDSQSQSAIALGYAAGLSLQGNNAVALGPSAGSTNQGANAIAIGNNAGASNQASNSIVLNASENQLNPANSGFFVNPLRSAPTSTSYSLLLYNTATKEIVNSLASTSTQNKTFIINHPTKPDSYLVHACLEGPEAGVYYRGESTIENNQSVVVKLPDYVSSFATNFSINITPIYSDDSDENIVYRTSRVKDNAFTVHGKNGSFYWIVYGQRGKVDVEPKKSEVQVSGDGPYKYIKPGK